MVLSVFLYPNLKVNQWVISSLWMFYFDKWKKTKLLSKDTDDKILGTIFYPVTQMIEINSFHIFVSIRKKLTILRNNQKLRTLS